MKRIYIFMLGLGFIGNTYASGPTETGETSQTETLKQEAIKAAREGRLADCRTYCNMIADECHSGGLQVNPDVPLYTQCEGERTKCTVGCARGASTFN